MFLDRFGNPASSDENSTIGEGKRGFEQRAIELLGQPIFLQQEPYTCGPATARMLFYWNFGKIWKEEDFIRILRPNASEGTHYENFLLLNRVCPVTTTIYRDAHFGHIRNILDEGRFPIVRYYLPKSEVDHYALIIRMDEDVLYYIEPFFGGISTITREKFDRIWHTDPHLGPEERILIDIIPVSSPSHEQTGGAQ